MGQLDLKLDEYKKSLITINISDQYWCMVDLCFENEYFKYNNCSEMLQKTEVKRIYETLTSCLAGRLADNTKLSFDEDYLQFYFYKDKIDNQHCVELRIFTFIDEYRDYYSVMLTTPEMSELRDYLYELVKKF